MSANPPRSFFATADNSEVIHTFLLSRFGDKKTNFDLLREAHNYFLTLQPEILYADAVVYVRYLLRILREKPPMPAQEALALFEGEYRQIAIDYKNPAKALERQLSLDKLAQSIFADAIR